MKRLEQLQPPVLRRFSARMHGRLYVAYRIVRLRVGQCERRPVPATPRRTARPGWAKARRGAIARDGRCRKCRSSVDLQVHHMLERCKGGSDDLANLITLCALCHAEWTWCEPDRMDFATWMALPPARLLLHVFAGPWPTEMSALEFRLELEKLFARLYAERG